MKISGSGVVNANQEATVSLISGAIIENITSNYLVFYIRELVSFYVDFLNCNF